ncbi:endocuticle structural glycoprotein ABD-4-like [Onthophagus taurus]|uniref:endocuticle structural glycoprotein ABD-4-like n=1 Tax=Onthophagus taurus TaxID=166361 RepID=UPI000C2077C7|nr:endocuticle structural glycoprotein ABD-4-like [Onthophagus taurus]
MAFKLILLLSTLAAISLGYPAADSAPSQTPVPIVSQNSDFNGNGNFTYSYETGDGIKLQQAGFVKPIPPGERKAVDGEKEGAAEAQVINGSYSYTAPDGTAIELQYTADESGFHPQGSHLPTPPPVPKEIQDLLNSLPPSSAAPIARK